MTSPSSIEPALTRDVDEPRPRQRSARWRYLVLALSIAHFSLIQAWHGLLFDNEFGYFNHIPVNRASLGALLINIFSLGPLLWLIGQCVRGANRRPVWFLANVTLCAAILVPLNFLRTHYWHLTGGRLVNLAKEPVVIVAAVLAVILAIWFHRYAGKVVATVYLILSPMVLFTAAKTTWWIVRPPERAPEKLAAALPPKDSGPRVVWLLLDELDQRIAFDSRPAGVSVPELTRFYSECLHATNAFPPGGSTRYSLPALTIGREVRAAHATAVGELSFNGGARWSEADTVFSRARSLGFSTALVGWYHPYGRVLGRDLERCEWYAYPPFEEERGRTVTEAAVNQLCSIVSQLQQRRLHVGNVAAAESASLDALTNSPAALTLLHLPVPHLPGIYDPRRDRLTIWKYSRNREYLENLVLADRIFGRLRRSMESAGTWETTWVVLSSDHWWREAASYDGKTDHRVPFIIKAPGKNESAIYGNKFNTVVTYHLILSILKGELTNASQFPQWLDTFRTDPPSHYGPEGEPF